MQKWFCVNVAREWCNAQKWFSVTAVGVYQKFKIRSPKRNQNFNEVGGVVGKLAAWIWYSAWDSGLSYLDWLWKLFHYFISKRSIQIIFLKFKITSVVRFLRAGEQELLCFHSPSVRRFCRNCKRSE